MKRGSDFDVIIAGAGPAGIATAVSLLRGAGLAPQRVLVLDRARFPRPKPCGGGLTGHALAELAALGLSLRVPHVASRVGRIVYRHVVAQVSLPRPVRIARREELDADLVAQARAFGVDVREGDALRGFTVQGDGVLVGTSDGATLSCRVLVGADGAVSAVRRHLTTQSPTGARPIRMARLEIVAPSDQGGEMVYDFTPLDRGVRGYVWLFPVPGGRVNVGIMSSPSGRLGYGALHSVLGDTLRCYGVTLPRAARGWPAWEYDPEARIAGLRLLCVGDAAGIDALTGEGIAVALAHGSLAAQAITSAMATGDFRFRGYREAIRAAHVGRQVAVDRLLARLLYGPADARPLLALMLFDQRLLRLYAGQVSGTEVLADRKLALLAGLGRHLFLGERRLRALEAQTG